MRMTGAGKPPLPPEVHQQRKAEILQYIKETIDERGYNPTTREMAVRLGLSRFSVRTAWQYCQQLIEEGYLERPQRGFFMLRVLRYPYEN